MSVLRLAAVSYLNSKPLLWGLDRDPAVELSLDVPSALAARLQGGADAALLPVIDYQRHAGLTVVPAGGIGCDGATLTVRIFSPTPMGQIRRLWCDRDSHTSVVLAQVVLAERYGVRPELTGGADGGGAARLLIGDKVISDEPTGAGAAYQVDLGAEWKAMTGLPFVFAVWTARAGLAGAELAAAYARLTRAREEGQSRIGEIVAEHAAARRWPADVARRYLSEYLRFEIGPRQIEAIGRFHAMAHALGLIERLRPLVVSGG